MELQNCFFSSYKVMLAAKMFADKKIDYLCYQYIMMKYLDGSNGFN